MVLTGRPSPLLLPPTYSLLQLLGTGSGVLLRLFWLIAHEGITPLARRDFAATLCEVASDEKTLPTVLLLDPTPSFVAALTRLYVLPK